MNTQNNKSSYVSYEEAGLKNPLFVPSFIIDMVYIEDPYYIDKKYFSNILEDNQEYLFIKNHIKKLNEYFYFKDSEIDSLKVSKICLKTNTENKFKIIYIVEGTVAVNPIHRIRSMIYPIDNGTNDDCLIIHKDILRSALTNDYEYYKDPLLCIKNLFVFLYGEDFLKEERKYENYNLIKMFLLTSLYFHLNNRAGFKKILLHIIEKYTFIYLYDDQNPEETKNDVITLKRLLAMTIDADIYNKDYENDIITIFSKINFIKIQKKSISFEDINVWINHQLNGLNNKIKCKMCGSYKKECKYETILFGLIDSMVKDIYQNEISKLSCCDAEIKSEIK